LIDLVNSGEKIDEDVESYKNKMQFASNSGVENLKTEWLKMPKHVMVKMKPIYSIFESSAKAFDDIQNSTYEYEPEKQIVKTGFTQAKVDNDGDNQLQQTNQQTAGQPEQVNNF
jgi:hypothetical protein